MRAIVIGGGIGGLAAGLSFHAAGIEATIFEAVSEVAPVGLGINIQPNAVRELTELGLYDQLAATAIETSTVGFYNKFGQSIWNEPRGRAAGYAWPQFSIHRGELLMILLAVTRQRLGAGNVRFRHRFTGFDEDAGGVTAHFVDARSGAALPSIRGDVLIGADGVHSTVRRHFYPNEQAVTRGAGYRGVVEMEPYLDGRTMVIVGNKMRRAVIYPVGGEAMRRGRSLVNFILNPRGHGFDVYDESWDTRSDSRDELKAIFSDWDFPWLSIPDMIVATEAFYRFPSPERDPLPRWSFGRVTMIGDAAHAMRAAGSQAGSQAIVDARVLAWHLASAPSAPEALTRYEADRLPSLNEILLQNRQFGPEIVMDIAEERAPDGFARIEDVVPRAELEEHARAYKELAGFDVEALNRRASYSVR